MLDFDSDIIRRVIDKTNLIPRNDNVIVFRAKLNMTAGGIVVPDNQSAMTQGVASAGVVIAAGPGRFIEISGGREPVELEPGDVVLFSAMAGLKLGEVLRAEVGTDVSFEELRLIRSHDLLFKLRDRNVLKFHHKGMEEKL